jgi:adenine/guanine/hypoxanthine permease
MINTNWAVLKQLGITWQDGDWDAFLTLGTNNLANMVILPAILIGTFHFPSSLVFGRLLPGLCLTLLIGMAWLAVYARRVEVREGRTNVTALPYGISTPVMFVYLFAIIGPVYFATQDPLIAYRVGLGAAFIGGLIEISGAVVGPWLEKNAPRAGMLGTIAGVSIVWIAMIPSAIIFANPLIGLPALFVVLLGLVGQYKFPFRMPAGLVAILLGIILGLVTKSSTINLQDTGFYLPVPMLGDMIVGVRLLMERPELLAVIIPIEIYNFIETSGNVASAKAAGDEYDMRKCQLIDGFGTCLGAMFGSPFPTTIFIGHPAFKTMQARTGYMWASGAFLFGASLLGLFSFLQHLIPAASVSSLLVFVGIVITNYAFSSTPPQHGVAIAFAMLPHIADLLKKQLGGTILEVLNQGTISGDLASRLAGNQGVYLQSYVLLSNGAIITGLLWGSILAFLIDHNLRRAIFFSLLAAVLSLSGVIHADHFGLSITPISLSYLVLAAVLGGLYLLEPKKTPTPAVQIEEGVEAA